MMLGGREAVEKQGLTLAKKSCSAVMFAGGVNLILDIDLKSTLIFDHNRVAPPILLFLLFFLADCFERLEA